MVPISKSIWPFILFVYLNLHFMLMVRFNLLYCFSKIFFQERSKASPPNFAPSFCALCLIVCDFLSKTWNLGRKAPVKKGFRKVRVCVAMKAPVGLLSGRAVCVSRWRGFAPTSSAGRSKRIFTEKAAEMNGIFRHDPSCEKGVQESPQTFLNPEI